MPKWPKSVFGKNELTVLSSGKNVPEHDAVNSFSLSIHVYNI
jgi:hypothetical protein